MLELVEGKLFGAAGVAGVVVQLFMVTTCGVKSRRSWAQQSSATSLSLFLVDFVVVAAVLLERSHESSVVATSRLVIDISMNA